MSWAPRDARRSWKPNGASDAQTSWRRHRDRPGLSNAHSLVRTVRHASCRAYLPPPEIDCFRPEIRRRSFETRPPPSPSSSAFCRLPIMFRRRHLCRPHLLCPAPTASSSRSCRFTERHSRNPTGLLISRPGARYAHLPGLAGRLMSPRASLSTNPPVRPGPCRILLLADNCLAPSYEADSRALDSISLVRHRLHLTLSSGATGNQKSKCPRPEWLGHPVFRSRLV
jgi:hypothetical protein